MATLTKKAFEEAYQDIHNRIHSIRLGIDEKTSNIRTRLANAESATVEFGQSLNRRSLTGAIVSIVLFFTVGIHLHRSRGWKEYWQNQNDRIEYLGQQAAVYVAHIDNLNAQVALLNEHGRVTNKDFVYTYSGGYTLIRRESGAIFWIPRGGTERRLGESTLTQDGYLKYLKEQQDAARERYAAYQNDRSRCVCNGYTVWSYAYGACPCQR